MTIRTRAAIIVAWLASVVDVLLIACMVPVPLLMAYGGLGGFATAQEPIAPLVVDADGKPVCGEWPEVLLKTGEKVKLTLSDRYGQKIKVLVDGQSWRLVLMAGAEDSKFGCSFAEGDGVIGK